MLWPVAVTAVVVVVLPVVVVVVVLVVVLVVVVVVMTRASTPMMVGVTNPCCANLTLTLRIVGTHIPVRMLALGLG